MTSFGAPEMQCLAADARLGPIGISAGVGLNARRRRLKSRVGKRHIVGISQHLGRRERGGRAESVAHHHERAVQIGAMPNETQT
jgi:hypothetical protein